jgi:AsmA protein
MIRLLLAIIVIIGIAAGGVLFLLENPDRFKAQIAQVAEANTGYQVTIDGELSWRYWPPIAINVEQLAFSGAGKESFATFNQISIDVDLLPLLTQQQVVDINNITINGGEINLVVDSQGKGNWELDETASTASSGSGSGPTDVNLTSTIKQLQIGDVQISYTDVQADNRYDLSINSLTTSTLTTDKPFDFSASATVIDHNENTSGAIESSGQLIYHSDSNKFTFDQLVTATTITVEDTTYPTLTLSTDGEWRGGEQVILLSRNDMQLSSLAIKTTGIVTFNGEQPRFDGVLSLESADPSRLANDFDLDLPISSLQLEANVAANPDWIEMLTLEGRADESSFKGTARIAVNGTALAAELRFDTFDASTYIDGEALATASPNRPDVSVDTEFIPIALLREIKLDTIIRFDQLKLEDTSLTAVKVETNSDRKNLQLIANAKGYEGNIVLSLDTHLSSPDTSTGTSTVTSTVTLNAGGLNITALTDTPGITGALTANSDLQFSGSKMSHFNESLRGKTVFSVKDGSLDVRPIRAMAQTIDSFRNQRSPISDWPDVMPFDHMLGEHIFNQGLEAGQVINAELENLSITAIGGINLTDESLAYDVTAMFKQAKEGQFKVGDQLTGIRWPMSCAGKFTDSPSDLCFGKDGAISQLVAEIVKQDLKRKSENKIEKLINDKVPEELKDLTTELFKNLFK